ncbi:condensation domain-containing protein [Pseudomonas syringae]|uniref:condensation domain-containing protein n=1 Tax=Pseudomonas syringae TaxID=317 RepID=UPI0020BE5745|nr:condensation domain-containing protein [Pseudomonas syringae]MCL6309469.1 condensation domain-containing protein [Pseudomonas syringae]
MNSSESIQATPAQLRLWLLHQFQPNTAEYNVPLCFHVENAIDVDALTAATNSLVGRHASFRTSFVWRESTLWQTVSPNLNVTIQNIDVGDTPISKKLIEYASEPFKLDEAPLLRVYHIVSNNESYLLINAHHIIIDGWSLSIMLSDLRQFYGNALTGDINGAKAKDWDFPDYARIARSGLIEGRAEQLKDFWQPRLNGARTFFPELQLFNKHRETKQIVGPAMVETLTAVIDESILKPLLALCVQYQMSLQPVLFTCLGFALATQTRRNDVPIAYYSANRMLAKTHDIIGFFASTLVHRMTFGDDDCVAQVLSNVRDALWEEQEHEDLMYDSAIEWADCHEIEGRPRSFPILMVMDSPFQPSNSDSDSIILNPVKMDMPENKFDISINVVKENEHLLIKFVGDNSVVRFEALQETSLLLKASLSKLCQSIGGTFDSHKKMLTEIVEVAQYCGEDYGLDEYAAPKYLLEESDLPVGSIELEMVRIWQVLLNRKVIHRNDNFFRIGGHSLHAVKLSVMIREQLGVDISLRELFERATLSCISSLVTELQLSQFSTSDSVSFHTKLESLSESELFALLSDDEIN